MFSFSWSDFSLYKLILIVYFCVSTDVSFNAEKKKIFLKKSLSNASEKQNCKINNCFFTGSVSVDFW